MISLNLLVNFLYQNKSNNQLFVFGIGDTSKQAYISGFTNDESFFVTGSWGTPPSLGIGLALGSPDKEIIVVDGDGALLHSPSFLATAFSTKIKNFHYIVVNNGVYGSSGGQEIASLESGLDLARLIEGFGFNDVKTIRIESDLCDALRMDGDARFSVVKIFADKVSRPYVPLNYVKSSFAR